MKHLEVRQKDNAQRSIFKSLLNVSSVYETLRLMLDILLETFQGVANRLLRTPPK